jgi:filamentous hemagglutinin family protein
MGAVLRQGAGQKRWGRGFRALTLASVFTLPAAAQSPQGGTVVVGGAGISSQGTQTLINQTTDRALIDWRGFDIGAGHSVAVTQPGAGSLLVNRVIGHGTGTRIGGSLTANGQVVVIDKAGIVMGRGARIDAGAFLATTADIDNADFAAGRLTFGKAGLSGAAVVNEGIIRVADAGYAVLAATEVRNSGLIEARFGRVVLAGAERFTLDLAGDGLLRFEIPAELAGRVLNDGTLTGAEVLMTARAARDGLAGVVNAGGLVEAIAAREVDGRIIIGGEGVETEVSGTVRAEGGSIDVLGDKVTLTGATVDASGPVDGGSVRIGGDFQGGGDLHRSQTTRIDAGSRVMADGRGGDGGHIIIWSDGRTVHEGAVSARGAADGGFAEVSGKGSLRFAGTADLAGGAGGKAGELLLDPTNITIGGTPNLNGDGTTGDDLDNTGDLDNVGDQGAVNSVITAGAIETLLNSGTSVTLAASDDININSSIAKTGGTGAALTLNAGQDISFASGIGVSSSSGTLSMSFNAGRSFQATGGSFSSNGGSITVTATGTGATTGVNLSGASFSTGSGALTLTGTGSATGVLLTGNSTLSSGNGTLSVTGTGAIGVDFARATATTGSGAVSITGTANGSGTGSVGIRLDGSSGGGISSTSGTVGLTGTGSSGGTGTANHGVLVMGGFGVTSGSGKTTVTATEGAGSVGLIFSGSGNIGGASSSQAGDVELRADSMHLTGASVRSSGRVTLRTRSNATNLIIGGTDDTAGLALSTAELGTVTAGTLVLGHGQHTGAVTVSANPSTTGIGAFELISGSLNIGSSIASLLQTFLDAGKNALADAGVGDITVSNSIAKSAGGDATLTLRAAQDLTFNAGIGASSSNDKLNVDATAGYGGSSGTLTAGNGSFNSNGGDVSLRGRDDLVLNSTTVSAGAGTIILAGGDIALSSTSITSTGRVQLRPFATGGQMDVGATGAGSGKVHVSQAEINQISAGVIRLGALDGGNLVISSGLSHASDTVELASAGTVTQSAAINVEKLSLLGTGGSYTLTNGSNNVTTLAGNTGSVDFRSTDAFSVGTVAGTTGLTFTGNASLYAAASLITLGQAATYAGSGTGTLTLSSDIDVTVSANVGVSASGKVNIVLAADGNESGSAGRVAISGATLSSNGGNITIGSGSTPASRAAEGKADTGIGVNITSSTLNSGSGGTILINGDGAPSGTNSATGIGINVSASSLIAAGSGTITLNGSGGTGNTLTAGIAIGNGSTIRSASGAIALNGAQAASGTNRYGILLRDDPGTRSAIYSTGGGALGLTATGTNGLIAANGGSSDSSRAYIGWDGTNAYAGPVTLTADRMTLTSGTGTAAISIGGTGNLVIRPGSTGASIGVGDGAASSDLELGQTELDTLRAGFSTITVGRSDGTGATSVAGAAFKDNTSLISDTGAISISGALSTGSGADAGSLSANTKGLLTVSAAISTQNQDITLTADRLNLTGSVDAGTATATLTTSTAARGIDLGSATDSGSGLEISSAELNRVTAGTIRIGSSSAGAISVTGAIAPTGSSTLHLRSGGAVSQTGAITVTNLAVTAGGAVSLSGVNNAVTTFAATTGSSNGAIALRDDTGFAVGTVDGVTGVNAGMGNLTLTSTGAVTQSAAITASGLSLNGAGGAYTLAHASNAVSTVAANTGSVDVGLSGAVSIGTIGSVAGVNATGMVKLTSGGNLTLASGASVAANGPGDALILAANGTFTNSAGSSALSVTGGGRFLVFSNSPLTSITGGISALPLYNRGFTFTDRTYTAVSNSGSRFVYGYAPTLTVTPDSVSRVYTGSAITGLNYTITGLVTGDTLTNAVSGTGAITGAGRNVGSYTLTAGAGTLSSDLGYGFSYGTGTLTVTKKSLTYSITNSSSTYGTTATGGTVTLGGLVDGDGVTGTVTTYRGTDAVALAPRTAVGSLTQKVTAITGSDVGNYELAVSGHTDGTLTIAAKELTYNVGAVNSIYGTLATLGTATLTGVVNGDDVTASVSLSGVTLSDRLSAGTYDQTVTLGGGDVSNYRLANSGSSAGNLTVARKSVNFSIANVASTYGTLAVLGTPSLTGVLSGDDVSGAVTLVSGTLSDRLKVGTYDLTLTALGGGSASNYVLAGSGNSNGVLTIAAKALTASVASVTATYGQNAATGAVTLTGLLAGDDVKADVSVEGAGGAVTPGPKLGAGTYTQRINGLTGADAGNYVMAGGQGATGTLTINPAALTVTANSLTRVYGADDPILTYSVTGLVNGDGLTGGLTRAAGRNAGTYAIGQGSLSAGANYTLTFNGGTLTITPAALTVTAASATKVYGSDDPALTYSVSGLVAGDSVSGALTRAAGRDVGTYAINQGSLSAGSNYTLTFNGGTLTITPAALTVTAGSGTKIYGDADPVLGFTAAGLVAGDSLTGEIKRAAGENAGTYAVEQGSLSAGANYTLSFNAGTLTITPAALSVTANAVSRIYMDEDPELTFTVNGLKRGDSAASALSGALSRAGGEDVGTYAIAQGSLTTNANYKLGFTGADFVIRPANLTLAVVAANLSKIYGDADPALTYTATGLRGKDSLDKVLSGVLSRAGGEDAGTYAINQGSLTSISPNYTVSFTPGTLTISPANLSVAAAMVTRTYGDGDPALTYAVSGLKRGDSAGAVLSGSLGRAAGEDAGTYAINQGSLALTSRNYTLSFTGAQMVINPALLSVTANAVSRIYGAADPALTFAVSGLKRDDSATGVLTGGLVRAGGGNAGRYAITQGSLSTNGNYRVSFTGADFTITPAPLSVLVDNATRQAGAANPVFTARFQGLVNGDTSTVLTGLRFQTLADAASPAGNYAINADGISNGNYQITYVDGLLTVTGGGVLPPVVAETAPVTIITKPVTVPVVTVVAAPVAVASPVVTPPPAPVAASPAPAGDGGSAALAAVNQSVQSASGSAADDDSAAEEMIPGLLSQQRRLPGETPDGTPGLEQQFPNLGRVW